MNLTRLLAALVSTFAVVASTTSPAAAASGTTSATDGVLFPGCEDHPYSYSLDLPPEATGWSMDVTVRGPDGLEAASDFVYDAPDTGSAKFLLCGSDLAGTYDIEGEVEWHDEDYNSQTFTLSASTFEMRKPLTRTTLKPSTTDADRGDVVRFVVTSLVERPHGYFPNEYASVVLQSTTRGSSDWTTVRGTKTYTNDRGKAVIKARMSGGQAKVRARTAPSSAYSPSSSAAVLIR